MMPRRLILVAMVAGFCLALPDPVWSANELAIACEGTESNGGGGLAYQYTLRNTGATAVTLSMFYVGTFDLSLSSYSNWTSPPGFLPAVLIPTPPLSVMSSDQVKTPHGALMQAPLSAAPGVVVWSGGNLLLAPGQTATFGFDHPNASWDMEWFAEHPAPPNTSAAFPNLPIAGPLGVFTHGFVHGPGIEPIASTPQTFGRIKAAHR